MMTYLTEVSICNNDLSELNVYGSTAITDLNICQNTKLTGVEGLESLNNLEVFSFIGVPVKFDISSNTKLKIINIDTIHQNPMPITEKGVIDPTTEGSPSIHGLYVAANDSIIATTATRRLGDSTIFVGTIDLHTIDGTYLNTIHSPDEYVSGGRMGRLNDGISMSNTRIITSDDSNYVSTYENKINAEYWFIIKTLRLHHHQIHPQTKGN